MARVRLEDLGGVDPYDLLGVDYDADNPSIVAAHRQLIRQVHPDLPDGDEELAKMLHVARDVLLDPDLRRAYDSAAGVPASEAASWPAGGSHRRRATWTVRLATWWLTWARPRLAEVPPGVWALLAAIVFPPAGLWLGLRTVGDPWGRVDQACAILAVAWGMTGTLCGGGYLALRLIN